MVILFIILFPFIEIYTLIAVGREIGTANTIFALLASAALGVGMARSQGIYVLRRLQEAAARGEAPTKEVLQSILIFIGGALFVLPGFVSDAIGLLFILPGTRHLLSRWVAKRIARNSGQSGFRIFTGGFSGGFSGSTFGGFRDVSPPSLEQPPEVIDVTATVIDDGKDVNQRGKS